MRNRLGVSSATTSFNLISRIGTLPVILPYYYSLFLLSLTLSLTHSYQYPSPPSFLTRGSLKSFAQTSLSMSASPSVLSPHASSAFTSRRAFSTSESRSLFSLSTDPSLSRTCLESTSSSATPVADSRFFDVKVLGITKEAEGLRLVTIEVPVEVAERYNRPGQYVKLRVKDGSSSNKPAYFAIASPPTNPAATADPTATVSTVFTFLIKETPQHDFVLSGSSPLEISVPLGSGFNIPFAFNGYKTDFPVMNILLFATGSGIAPIASVIDSNQLATSNPLTNLITTTQGIKLYYGVKTPKHIPFQSKLDEWKRKGIEIIPVLSQPNDPASAGWTGKRGYIQDIFREDGVRIPRNSAALLCGQRGMTDSIKDTLLQAGVFEGRILYNF